LDSVQADMDGWIAWTLCCLGKAAMLWATTCRHPSGHQRYRRQRPRHAAPHIWLVDSPAARRGRTLILH